MPKSKFEGFYYERRENSIVLIDVNGEEYNPLQQLPYTEDYATKVIIEDWIPHLIIGKKWYIFDKEHFELEKIEAPLLEKGNDTGKVIVKEFVTVESVEKAHMFWEKIIDDINSLKKRKEQKQ